MVKLIHKSETGVKEEPVLSMEIMFSSGNTIETEGNGYIYESLGDDTIGIVDMNVTDIPHLVFNKNNVDYIIYSEVEYEDEEDV